MNIAAAVNRLARYIIYFHIKKLLLAIMLIALSPIAIAQQTTITPWTSYTVNVSSGGSLSFQMAQVVCYDSNGNPINDFINFSYRDMLYTSPSGQAYVNPFTLCSGATGLYPPVELDFALWQPPNYTPTGTTAAVLFSYENNSATIASLIDPLYKVVSIVYAMPGNGSSSGYGSTTTNGTVFTMGANFQSGVSVSANLSATGDSPGASAGVGITLGHSVTSGYNTATTETITDAQSISNVSNSASSNTASHNQDLFVLWLNPEVVVTQTGSNAANYYLQTPSAGYYPVDTIRITAESLQSVSGATHVPLTDLQKQFDSRTGLYDLPGLAKICADQSQYVNNCPAGGQCGCVASDFADILAQDPLLNGTTATNPLSVDTSGAVTCTNPTSTSSCRYVTVPASKGSPIQYSNALTGPTCVGCGHSTNTYSVTDANSTSTTFSENKTSTLGSSVNLKFGIFSASITRSFAWTDTESRGLINGTANQMQYLLSSSTVNCSQIVLFYEDTIYHTFVGQQAPGNNSCP